MLQRTYSVPSNPKWIRHVQVFMRNKQLFYSTNETNKTKVNEEKAAEVESEDKMMSNLEEEIKKLNESVADVTEKYKRSLAETENVRMRLRKEISDAKQYGIQSFCKDMLTVADVMQMAVSSIPGEKVKEETNEMWRSFYEGVCMTNKELHNVFERHGLVVVEPKKGDKFDPNDHEALFESPIDGMDPGTIALVQRIGYKLKGRTLRPAQVGITGKRS